MMMMGSGFQSKDEWNLLIFEFWLNFLSTNCLISSAEIKGFMFFMTTFIKPVWVRGFVQELPGKILFISISNVSASFSVSVWMATPPSGWATQYQMVICWLENSLIYFFICVEILGLKVCGMLSINQIFRLEWEFFEVHWQIACVW